MILEEGTYQCENGLSSYFNFEHVGCTLDYEFHRCLNKTSI